MDLTAEAHLRILYPGSHSRGAVPLGYQKGGKMRPCCSTLVAVLVLGISLQSSRSTAEAPVEEPANAAPIAFASGGAQCLAPAPAASPEPIAPVFLSCSAQATCWDNSTISCSFPSSGSCTGVDSSCPGQPGYVQCPDSFIPCPVCPGTDCTLYCSVDSECTSHCGGPGRCSTGCDPNKPYIKMCVCLA